MGYSFLKCDFCIFHDKKLSKSIEREVPKVNIFFIKQALMQNQVI